MPGRRRALIGLVLFHVGCGITGFPIGFAETDRRHVVQRQLPRPSGRQRAAQRTFEIVKLVFAKNPRPTTAGATADPQSPANAVFSVEGRDAAPRDRWTSPVEIAARQWSPDTVQLLLDQ